MTNLLLVHGWGFGPDVWEPLRSYLPPGLPVETLDLGFRDPPRLDLPPAFGEEVVAVGHSLGLLWLLQQRPCAWKALVSINGFARFTQAADFPHGVAPRPLARMRAKLAGDLAGVTGDFLARCGLSSPAPLPSSLNGERLAEGLGWLAEWDGRAALEREPRLLALAGRQDPIVPPALTLDSFSTISQKPDSRLLWVEDGGHLLPLTHPRWCAEGILAWLDQPLCP